MFEMPFYYRYVDDIALAVPRNKSKEVLDLFNSVHPRLQLALEIDGKCLNYLDVTIINNNNVLQFDYYTKPTFSGRFLSLITASHFTKKRYIDECKRQNIFIVTSSIPPKEFWFYHKDRILYSKRFLLDWGFVQQKNEKAECKQY